MPDDLKTQPPKRGFHGPPMRHQLGPRISITPLDPEPGEPATYEGHDIYPWEWFVPQAKPLPAWWQMPGGTASRYAGDDVSLNQSCADDASENEASNICAGPETEGAAAASSNPSVRRADDSADPVGRTQVASAPSLPRISTTGLPWRTRRRLFYGRSEP